YVEESPAGIDRRSAHCKAEDLGGSAVVVRDRVPGAWNSSRCVERCDTGAGQHTAEVGERPTHVDGRTTHSERQDGTIRVRIPRGGVASRGVALSAEVASLPADARESAPRVTGGSAHRQRHDLTIAEPVNDFETLAS